MVNVSAAADDQVLLSPSRELPRQRFLGRALMGIGYSSVTHPPNAAGFLAAATGLAGLDLSSGLAGWIASRKSSAAFTGATGVFGAAGAGGVFGLPSKSGTVSILTGSGFVCAGTAAGAMPGLGFGSAFAGAAKEFFGEPNFGNRAAVRIR